LVGGLPDDSQSKVHAFKGRIEDHGEPVKEVKICMTIRTKPFVKEHSIFLSICDKGSTIKFSFDNSGLRDKQSTLHISNISPFNAKNLQMEDRVVHYLDIGPVTPIVFDA